jgi:hypothetical protein
MKRPLLSLSANENAGSVEAPPSHRYMHHAALIRVHAPPVERVAGAAVGVYVPRQHQVHFILIE